MKNIISRLTGIISGIIFTVLFLMIPLINGCESSKATIMIKNGLSSSKSNDQIYAAILIAIIVLVIVGILLFALDKVISGSVSGFISMAGLVFLFFDAKKGIGLGFKDLSVGAIAMFISSILMSLSFVGLLLENKHKHKEMECTSLKSESEQEDQD